MNIVPRITGTIFDIKRCAMKDGPGIRTTVFLKGCPLRCPWCHNPESQSGKREFIYRQSRCIGCGNCLKQCGGLRYQRDILARVPDKGTCAGCSKCVDSCPTGALTIAGRMATVDDVLAVVLKDKDYYGNEGGVTFSGGEPFFQAEFLKAALMECKKKDIKTCVETSGFCQEAALDEVKDMVDLFIYDVKLFDGARSGEIIGADSESILQNLGRLIREKDIVVRMPLIEGITDTGQNIGLFAALLERMPLKRLLKIELLPCHNYGEAKYHYLGKEQPAAYRSPTPERMNEIKAIIERYGVRTEVMAL